MAWICGPSVVCKAPAGNLYSLSSLHIFAQDATEMFTNIFIRFANAPPMYMSFFPTHERQNGKHCTKSRDFNR